METRAKRQDSFAFATSILTLKEAFMDIQLADVVVHIDQTLERERRSEIEEQLRAIDGVVSVHNPDDRPHLAIIEYNPDRTSSAVILNTVTVQGVHAELVGL